MARSVDVITMIVAIFAVIFIVGVITVLTFNMLSSIPPPSTFTNTTDVYTVPNANMLNFVNSVFPIAIIVAILIGIVLLILPSPRRGYEEPLPTHHEIHTNHNNLYDALEHTKQLNINHENNDNKDEFITGYRRE